MKVIGLLLGLLVGAGLGGFAGALAGALLGWLGGAFLARVDRASPPGQDVQELGRQLADAQKSIRELRSRMASVEARLAAGVAPEAGAASAAMATPEARAKTMPAEQLAGAQMPVTATPGFSPEPAPVPAEDAPVGEVPVTPPSMVAPAVNPALAKAAAAAPALPPAPVAPSATKASPATAEHMPAAPGLVERLLEGNLVAKLGVVILFFGVGFLLKFAYDRGMFPPELRLLGVAAASVAMFVIGQRLLASQRTYAVVLMGGAMGLLYVDVFFALKSFALISAPVGFALFAALGVATLLLAVRLDARAFAVLGLTGAFMAPILASTGSGNHVLLFSYYLILNLVILGASWFKAWRDLNFVGFLFTFAIALLWGANSYTPAHFRSVEPFLIAFFLLYLAIPILFAQRQPPELKGLVDATLVFGMPLSTAMLQAALTRGMGDQILAWSALGASVVYAGLAFALWRREHMRLLAEAHLALAIVFGTVAPYFAFDGYPTFAFWTLEGAAIYWMGCRQKSVLARGFALFLQLAAASYFWWVTQDQSPLLQNPPWFNERVIGCLLIAAASLLTGWFMKRFAAQISETEVAMQGPLVGWAGIWLLYGLLIGICSEWSTNLVRLPVLLAAIGACLLLAEFAGGFLDWRALRLAGRAHALLLGAMTIIWAAAFPGLHPLVESGMAAWPVSFAVYFFMLHRQVADGTEVRPGWRFAAGWVLLLAVATWEVLWRYGEQQFLWVCAIALTALAAAAVRFHLRERPADAAAPRRSLSQIPLWWAIFWWFAGLHGLIERYTPAQHHLALHLAALASSGLLFEAAGSLIRWPGLRSTQWLLSAGMLVTVVYLVDRGGHPFAGAGFLAWTVTLLISTFVLRRLEQAGLAWQAGAQHLFAWNLAWLLAIWDLHWRLDRVSAGHSWQFAAEGAVLAAWLALTTLGIRRNLAAFGDHAGLFTKAAAWPLMLLVFAWTMAANIQCSGDLPPLPHLPLVNPLDLAQLALLAAGIWASRQLVVDEEARRILPLLFALAGFFWLNAALLRSVHHWGGVPFELHALLRSVTAQAALSLLWTSTALVMMTIAVKQASRPRWMAGAALLALVVFKLFVNDLGNTGTVARIVSFIGVGVLLLVIGYVAPVPPRATTTPEPKETA